MICRDVMKTHVQCVGPQTTVRDAARRMRDENVGFLPVCDDNRKILGTMTDRDIVTRIVAADQATDQSIARFLTRRVVACSPADDLSYAEDLMSQERVSRILCVNERGELEGVLSLSDIAEVEPAGRAAATLRNVSLREVRGSSRDLTSGGRSGT